ncbi:hypothetical protein D3C71_1782220 [compost metagenome]
MPSGALHEAVHEMQNQLIQIHRNHADLLGPAFGEGNGVPVGYIVLFFHDG